MIEIGKFNQLKIKSCNHQIYFEGGEFGDILLSESETLENADVGDTLNVFVYNAHKGQLAASLKTPKAEVDEIAWLKVVEINKAGAFLDWGLDKDLFVPFNEQRYRMEQGKYYFVKLFVDDKDRIAATTKFERFLIDESYYFKEGQQVEIVIFDKTDLGFKAIVNNSHWGVLYQNEVFQPLRKGQKLTAYIKQIREDKKIDLSLQVPIPVHERMDDLSEKILNHLTAQNGYLPLGDKSLPEEIYRTFAVSKKAFKQAIGALYKRKLIIIEQQAIRLNNS